MSCCKPGYREIVNEKEKEINRKGKDELPPIVKMVATLILLGATATTAFLL